MAFTVENLRNNHKQVKIYISGNPLNVKIDLDYLTQAVMDEYREASEDRDYDRMADVFGKIVVEWDLLEHEDGPPLEITADVMQSLPLRVLNAIWDEIATSISPKSRKKSEK